MGSEDMTHDRDMPGAEPAVAGSLRCMAGGVD